MDESWIGWLHLATWIGCVVSRRIIFKTRSFCVSRFVTKILLSIVCGLGTSVEVPRYICSGTSLTLVRPFFLAVVKSTVRVTHSCVASSVLPELGPLDPVHDVIWLWLDSSTASKLYTRILIQRQLHIRGWEFPCALFSLQVSRYFSTPKMSSDFVKPGAFRYRASLYLHSH